MPCILSEVLAVKPSGEPRWEHQEQNDHYRPFLPTTFRPLGVRSQAKARANLQGCLCGAAFWSMIASVNVSVSYWFLQQLLFLNLCAVGLCSTHYACLIKVQLTSFLARPQAASFPICRTKASPTCSFVCAQDLATRAVTSVLLLILPDPLHSRV